jgi:GT2 family glycosyltransferase/glycosyltransferase involved in cell wall biosynthesis
MTPQVSVIIPVYNALDLAQQCVESIFEAGAHLSFEVVIVDNGSEPDMQEWLAGHRQLRHLHYPEPLGFAKAVNRGASAAIGDVLVVLNSDTIVSPGWLDGLYNALRSDPSLGVVTPVTNLAGEPAAMDPRMTNLPPGKALALAAAKPNPVEIRYHPQRITFFCAALRREVWNEFGGLDETYGAGNFEDDDMCLRLRMAGYKLGIARHVFVYHFENATFDANSIDHGEWMRRNAALFAKRARDLADSESPAPRWPRPSLDDVSVVIEPAANGSIERTLRSLANQTVCGFEIVRPERAERPTRTWIAYLTAGDVAYPFHLETLRYALEADSCDAVWSEGWTAKPQTSDTVRRAGWMHHRSLDPVQIWQQTIPVHWQRLTWESGGATPASLHARVALMEYARGIYRRSVPYRTRLAIDARIRRLIGLPSIAPAPEPRKAQMEKLTIDLETMIADGIDAGRFASDNSLPAVLMLNTVVWGSVVQRPHHFARGLGARGHRVFWVETDLHPGCNWWSGRPFPEVAPNVHFIRLPGATPTVQQTLWDDIALKAMTSALAQVASAYGIASAIVLVNYPRWQPLAATLRDRCGWRVVYDYLDDQSAFGDLYGVDTRELEERLIETADLVITSSAVLQERMSGKRDALLLHNAADFDLFSSARAARRSPDNSPVAGFFGVFAEWLDTDLIRAAALRFPNWTFVFIGPETFGSRAAEKRWNKATDLPNIKVLPKLNHHQLAAQLAGFDVCLMPFLDMPVTRTMNAVKIYEYLAAGKPVVSRDLPEARVIGDLVSFYDTPDRFFEILEEAVATDTAERAQARRDFARLHDWSARIDILSHQIRFNSALSKS